MYRNEKPLLGWPAPTVPTSVRTRTRPGITCSSEEYMRSAYSGATNGVEADILTRSPVQLGIRKSRAE